MAVLLFPPRQIAFKVESAEGTIATSLTSDNLVQTINPELQLTPTEFPRELARRGFGTVPGHYSTGTAQLSFQVELAGHTANTSTYASEPKYGNLFNACGLESKQFGALESGAITSGPIQHGETLTGGTSAEVTTALGYAYTGDATVIVVKAAGPYTSGETVTGGTSAATFTQGATTALLGDVYTGTAWYPLSEDSTNRTLTAEFRIDGQRYTLYGMRGDVSFDFATHNRVIANFTFSGIYSAVDASANLSELASNSFNALAPPAFLNAASTLTPRNTAGTEGTAISGADLCWSTGTLALNNTVTVRPCANGTNGFLSAVISERAPTFTINPDDPGVAAYAYVNKLMEGSRARFYAQWGSAVGSRFRLKIPHLQTTSANMGERDARLMNDLTFACTLGQNDGASDTAVGADNEFLLMNF